MDHPLGVSGRESVRELAGVVERDLGGKRSAAERVPQGPAVEQLGDDVRGPVVRADVMDRDDVGMIQGSGGARLLLEAEHVAGVVVARRQHLERDVPIELQVVRHEDAAHSAATQLALDPVPIAEQLHRCSRRQAAPAEGVRQWARPKPEGADQVSFRALRGSP